jgi:hypothetical protein
MMHLKVLMQEKVEFCLVGDDDSGPEDALDDLDLECASLPSLRQSDPLNISPYFYNKPADFATLFQSEGQPVFQAIYRGGIDKKIAQQSHRRLF